MVEQDDPFASLDHSSEEVKLQRQASPAMEKVEAPLEALGIPADAFTNDGILKKPLNAFRIWLGNTTRNQRLAMAGEAGFEHSHTLTLQSRVFKEVLDQDTRNAYVDQARAQKSLYKERESILKSAGMLDALRPMRKRPSNATDDSAKFADDECDEQSDQHDCEEILMGGTSPKILPLAKRGKGSKASKSPTVLKRAVRSTPSTQLAGKRIKIKGRPSGRPAPTGLVWSQDLELGIGSNALETPRNDELAIAGARRLSSLSAAGVFVNRSSWSPSDLSTSQTTVRGSQLAASTPCWGQIPWANDGTSGSASPGDTSVMAYPTRNTRRASSEPSCMAFEYMFADEPPEPCIDLVPTVLCLQSQPREQKRPLKKEKRPNDGKSPLEHMHAADVSMQSQLPHTTDDGAPPLQRLIDRYQRHRQEFSEQVSAAKEHGPPMEMSAASSYLPSIPIVGSEDLIPSTNIIVDDWYPPTFEDQRAEDFELFGHLRHDEDFFTPHNDFALGARMRFSQRDLQEGYGVGEDVDPFLAWMPDLSTTPENGNAVSDMRGEDSPLAQSAFAPI